MSTEETCTPPVLAGGELAGASLLLRPWRGDARDVDVVMAATQDDQIRRFSSVGAVREADEARDWIATRRSPKRLDWAMEYDRELVGRVGLNRLDQEDKIAELGYWLLPSYRGRGLVTRAVQFLTQWAFDERQIGRLEIRHEPENHASCAVARRCGFVVEGTQRGAMLRGDRRVDLHLHARLATD